MKIGVVDVGGGIVPESCPVFGDRRGRSYRGEAKYFEKHELKKNDYKILTASCSISGVTCPYETNGGHQTGAFVQEWLNS